MKRLGILISAIVLVCAGVGFGAWHLYQNHLSGDVRRLLVAANDEHASEAEVRQYIAQARPLVRTRKDRELVGTFEQALALMAQVQEDQQAVDQEFRETLSSLGSMEGDHCSHYFYSLLDIERQYHTEGLKEPAHLKTDIEAANQQAKKCEDDDKQEDEARDKRMKENRKAAMVAMNTVRLGLGLKPIPEPKS